MQTATTISLLESEFGEPDTDFMIFKTDELREQYHKTSVLLQVVCQILELHVASYGVMTVRVSDTDDFVSAH